MRKQLALAVKSVKYPKKQELFARSIKFCCLVLLLALLNSTGFRPSHDQPI